MAFDIISSDATEKAGIATTLLVIFEIIGRHFRFISYHSRGSVDESVTAVSQIAFVISSSFDVDPVCS